MNRIYRLVWSEVLRAWIAVAENASSRGKRSVRAIALLAPMMMPMLTHAAAPGAPPVGQLPTGGVVSAGVANIRAGSVPGNAVLNIDQTSARAAINWDTFNVGSAAQVNFNQPSATAATLNRVLDSNPSQIFGKINANGQVFLSNPNGVVFGQSASVDVGGLVATTHGISDTAFMAGQTTLTRDGATGSVINAGQLSTALGGYIALLAPEVRNEGIVIARLGRVVMAAGDAFTINYDGQQSLAGVTVQPSTLRALVENKGAVLAPGGLIVLSAKALDRLQGGVVRNSGQIEATGLSMKGGRIVLEASTEVTLQDGVVDASNAAGHGGSVTLSAERVGLFGASVVEASGSAGGGDVAIGGGFQGQDAAITNAQQVAVGRQARIDASATQAGDGGQVVVWSEGQTAFAGRITARGGVTAGSGGQVEVSGKQHLDFTGTVNAGADHGAAGTLLLDPRNITVDAAGAAAVTDIDTFADAPSADSVISPNTLTAITNTGTAVTLQANNDITVNSSIVSANPAGSGGALTFSAGRSITLNASITTDNAHVSFTANDSAADANRTAATPAVFTNNSLIDAGTGTVSITMGTKDASGAISAGQVVAANLDITHNGPTAGAVTGQIDLGELSLTGNMTINADAARNVTNALGSVVVRGTTTVNVGTGDVTLNRATTDFNTIGLTAGNVTLNDTNAMRFGATHLSGNLIQVTRGPIAQTGDMAVAGTTSLTVNNGGYGYADPYINLGNSGNDFGGAVTLNVASTGETGTGGYVTIRDAGAIDIASANVNRSMAVTASGGVSLGSTTVGTDLTVSANGAITASGAVTVTGNTVLTAGTANDITLGSTSNNFARVQINSGNNVTLVDSNAIEFGYGASNMAGNLDVTAGGTISQYNYISNSAPITVGGNATFTVTAPGSDLLLGPSLGHYIGGWTGATNSIAGTVTTATTGIGAFRDIQLRNTNAAAGLISGLGSGLRDVLFYYDNAPSISLPAMTLTGSLVVDIQNGGITQTGALVVDSVSAGNSTFRAAAGADIVLANSGNDFNHVTVRNARDASFVDADAIDLYVSNGGFTVQRNLGVTAGGAITDTSTSNSNYYINASNGVATFNAGSANDLTLDNDYNQWKTVAVPAAHNVVLNPNGSVELGHVNASGTLSLDSRTGGTLTQSASTAVVASGNTTFRDFSATGGVTLNEADNSLGDLTVQNAPSVTIRENDAITQAAAWSGTLVTPLPVVTLTTSDDQAITLDQANSFGNLTLTQLNRSAASAGAVHVRETADSINGLTQGGAWTLHGTTKLDSGATSTTLNNPNNVLGPLQVLGGTGSTNGVTSSITIYARDTATTDAISDAGSAGAWATGTTKLVAYDSTGATAGGGNINLGNAGNVLGDIYLRATNATITENDSITDGVITSWNGAGDTGWYTSGATHLTVANAAGKSITLDNQGNHLGAIALDTTGTAGTLTAVLITDTTDLTQSAVWNVGAAPVTLDGGNNAIDLSRSGNVLGDISIITSHGTPTSVAITENDDITQASAWVLNSVPVTLLAENAKAVTLTRATNILGQLSVTGGTVSITESDNITQGTGVSDAWTTSGVTTLNAGSNAITLNNSGNVLGALAIASTPSAASITENDDITQAAAWTQGTTPFTLNAGSRDVLLTQAGNQLGDLTLTAQNVSVTENHAAGITDGGAWTVPGTTTLTAGSANPIVLNASPASDFGRVSVVSASSAEIADVNGIVLAASTVAPGGTFTVSAGGAITQTGAITASSLRLIGTGYATLDDAANDIDNLAAGFSGGDLVFNNAGSFAVGVIGGTSGITIGANDVSLTSLAGTVTGLSTVNASSSSLAVTAGAALSLPQMSIAGPQTYTAGGSGITLGASVTGTAAGAITFNGPVTLGADLSVQSTHSAIDFNGTLAGAGHQLTVNAGTGTVGFDAAVSNLGSTGDAGAALQLTSSGARFDSTLGANNGLAVTGPVTFADTVTLADGNAASVFTGQVTLGKAGGMNLSGYDGMTFNNGVLLQNGPAAITSNNAALAFQTAGSVSGPYALALDSGTQSLTGLDRLGGDLTSLSVTALNPTIPVGGVTIAGAQTYTATNGSSITLAGNVTSTAAGAITFNSPVTVGAAATVSSTDSAIHFADTLDGNRNLTVSSGSGTKTFTGPVGHVSALGSGTGAALTLQGSGTATFDDTLEARSGLSAAGPVVFTQDVTLANGDTGSTFAGAVTSGGGSGNAISGFDGIAFNGGLTLSGGDVSVASNGSTLGFGGAVAGPHALTLNALAGGAGTVTGLDQIGFASDLTGLTVTAQTLSLPGTGLAVAGPMSFSAAGGLTLNGAVGQSSGPATGQVDFNGPMTLATGPVTVTTHDAPVNFNGTVNGAQALAVNAGSGTTTFSAAVGATTALASLATDAGGTTALNGATVRTSGAQAFNDAVTLGAGTTLTGSDVTFAGSLDGAQALTVNASGTTTFGGVVGGNTALASLTTNAGGSTALNAGAVTTSGAQTYNDAVTLGADTTLAGAGLTFNGTLDGARSLTANAGTSAVQFNGAVGDTTALTALAANGLTVTAADVTTTSTQAYTAISGVTLGGDLSSTHSDITVTGPATLGADVAISTGAGAGNITFTGATSTVNGAHALTLAAGAGNVVLGGAAGGITPLTGMTISGNDLTLPGIATVGDANQSYSALNHITLNQSRTLSAPVAFTADSDGNGSGAFVLLNGVSLTAANNTLAIQAADLDLQGSSTLSSGSGLMSLSASTSRNIALGGTDAAGQMTISGSELARITSSGGLDLKTSGSGWIHVNGISAPQSQNITGTLGLKAQGTGDIGFVTAASTFNAVTANATGGPINVGVNLSSTNDAITFATPVAVAGASVIDSGGGAIRFNGTLAVDNDLTLTTGNGTLTLGGAVGSNKTLTMNLGGGSVTGLDQLQSALTGLTVNSTSGITLPALDINGPQVYNTGTITATGDLSGVGIAFNALVDMAPTSGHALALNAGAGTLAFNNLASLNANDLTLTADEINFARAVTGSGHLLMQPATASRNVAIGGTSPITGLNLTATDLAQLPIGTLASLTLGSATGTGTLDVAGTLNAPGKPLTLNGGGGISQSGGAITSGDLTLYAAGHGIELSHPANAFGTVALNGTPTALNLANTLDITQAGTAAWVLGSGAVTLDAGSSDITLDHAGNTFGTLTLTGRTVQVTEAAATDLGATQASESLSVTSSGTIHIGAALASAGNVALTAAGTVTQAAPLTIGGNLDITTSVAAGDVTIDNSGASATRIGNTQVGGHYVLTATGDAISQAAGASLQVRGDLTATGTSILLGGAGNLIGGITTLPATSTVEVRQAGVITLGDRIEAGNLTVISERTNRSFSSSLIGGDAVVLANPANNITGHIAVSASAPTLGGGADVQTGIRQSAGTALSVAGVASFTAEASSAGSLGIDLSNNGNQFGTLQLSGTTVNVKNAATGLTTIDTAQALTRLTLTTAGALAQNGPISAPALDITANGTVMLANGANDVDTLAVTSGGHAITYVDANGLTVAGINAGGAAVNLTAGANGGAGNLTQSAALQDVTALTVAAGGAITLADATNTIDTLAGASAGTGLQLRDASGGLAVSGAVHSHGGDLLLRTVGDLTLDSGARLQATGGDLVASTEGAGNLINNATAGAAALTVDDDHRWLVYGNVGDLVGGAHTVKGGLTSNFRHYGASFASYAPGAVSESGNGFIYTDSTATLTVRAAVTGAATQVYGDTPTGTLGYIISAGMLDSEDTTGNVISGGTAAFTAGLSSAMDVGSTSIRYTGGLTSAYTLIADTTGVTYTVTPAVLTYTANTAERSYGAADPVLGGSVSGFKLGQDASVLGGSASWSTPAGAGSNVGSYAINGGGYTAVNYTFAQAAGNASALTVNRANLTVTAQADSKTYDGQAYSGGHGVSYSGFANGEGDGVLGGTLVYGGSAQGARHAGSYTITPSGLTAGNYAISFASGALTVNRANLTLAASDTTKTYDGTLAASATAVATAGTQVFGGDSLSGGSFAYTDANAGSGNKTVTASDVTVNDGNGGNNYNVSYTANTHSTIERANITVAAANLTKTYDATLDASGSATVVAGTLYTNVSNGNTTDTLSGGSFAYTDANAGSGNKTVTASGVTVNDGNGGGNYNVIHAANTTSTIEQAVLTYAGSVADKVYDGSRTATQTGGTLSGFVNGEILGATTGSATFADANAGAGKAVTIHGIALVDGPEGSLASNYRVAPTASAQATISPRLLTVEASVADKVYDRSTSATLESFGFSGLVNGETLNGTHSGSTRFEDRNVAADKPVTITGITLQDGTGANAGLASNYTVPGSVTAHASITPATLNVAGLVAIDKVYDGTLVAHLNVSTAVLSGALGADDVQVSSVTGTFQSKDVGIDKPILNSGTFVLSGADAVNYTLVQPAGLTASITPRSLVVAATGVDKVYDASTAAVVNLSDNRVVGDVLTVSASAALLDKNVGVGKFVGVTDIAISGTDAGNYTVNDRAATFATVTRAPLSVVTRAADKVYDGNTSAALTGLLGGLFSGDAVTLAQTGAFDSRNAGTDKTVTVLNSLAGADLGNYTLATPVQSATASITPRAVSVSNVAAADKVYDGTTTAAMTGLLSGLFSGDAVTLAQTGLFDTKDIGSNKTVTVTHQLTGTDAGNYTLATPVQSTTASILGNGNDSGTGTGGGSTSGSDGLSVAPTLPVAGPSPSAPLVPSAPAALLDVSTPAVGSSVSAGNVNPSPVGTPAVAIGSPARSEVSVAKPGSATSISMVRPATTERVGVVAVFVTRSAIDSGAEVSFALPQEIAVPNGATDLQVTLMDDKPLPIWMRFKSDTRSLVLTAVPAGALPVRVMVGAGETRWAVLIGERSGS